MIEWKETDIGPIPIHWDIKTVDEIKSSSKKSIISGPFGSNISAKYFVDKGVPVIRGNNLSLDIHRKFKDEGFVFITEDKAIELGTWAEKDDIIFTAVGTIGQVGILLGNEIFRRYIISNKQLRLRVNEQVIEPLYAYYWFASPFMIDMILQRNTGSSVPLINLSVLKSLLIPVPPKKERTEIVRVLSSLDDKIDLLHRQNATLEKMAETLFRQWFLEEANEGTIDQLVTIQNGYAFKSKDFKEVGTNGVVKIKNISGGIIDIERTDFINGEVALTIQDRFKIKTGDILIAMTGAEIGKLGIIPKTNKNLWLNQRVGLLREKYKGAKYLAYLQLKSEFGQDYIENAATGSAQPNISGTGIESCGFPPLSEELIKKYSLQIGELYDKVIFNLGQIHTLTNLRDTLLPKLMSGEVRVEIN